MTQICDTYMSCIQKNTSVTNMRHLYLSNDDDDDDDDNDDADDTKHVGITEL